MAEDVWKSRFYAFMALRVGGLVMILLGLAIAFTGLLRPGGWPPVGAIVAVLGLIDAFVAPRLLRKQWEKQDRERQ